MTDCATLISCYSQWSGYLKAEELSMMEGRLCVCLGQGGTQKECLFNLWINCSLVPDYVMEYLVEATPVRRREKEQIWAML